MNLNLKLEIIFFTFYGMSFYEVKIITGVSYNVSYILPLLDQDKTEIGEKR